MSETQMLRMRGLAKTYPVQHGSVRPGIHDVTFEVPRGSFFTLLGPSGCGKTTTLRCIAGLERPRAGLIAIGGDVVFDAARHINVPPNLRDIGMVFQSYAIWPHMSVYENATFPLTIARRRNIGREQRQKRAQEVLAAVGLAGFDKRSATQLSGGQQQRLALARAIIHEPSLLLLDEPLSNLDVKLREEMRIELKRLQQQVGITAIYVTHDQSEALALSDTIAVMEGGAIVQIGTPHEIYHAPATRFVAAFIGTTNFLDGVLVANGPRPGGLAVRLCDRCVLECRAHGAAPAVGATVVVSVRPEIIRVAGPGASSPANTLPGRLTAKTFLGNSTLYHVAVSGKSIQVMVQSDPGFLVNDEVALVIDADKAIVLP